MNCGNCLIDRVEIVELTEDHACPTCGADYSSIVSYARQADEYFAGTLAHKSMETCGSSPQAEALTPTSATDGGPSDNGMEPRGVEQR